MAFSMTRSSALERNVSALAASPDMETDAPSLVLPPSLLCLFTLCCEGEACQQPFVQQGDHVFGGTTLPTPKRSKTGSTIVMKSSKGMRVCRSSG